MGLRPPLIPAPASVATDILPPMTTALYRFAIKLTLQGPILAKSSSPASFGLDAAVARDFKNGRPIIPGTLVEGRVRESLEQLGEGDPARLFGKETKEDTNNEPSRGQLLIGDLAAAKPGSDAASLSRVALDGTLGSAKGEMLREIETPFLAGDEVVFAGEAEMFCANEGAADEIARLLRMGLLWQTQFGALRTTGFGKVLGAEVTPAPAKVEEIQIDGAPLALDLAIAPRGPLCITKPKIGDNLFESEITIPGNMLAGAVMQTAESLGLAEELKKVFDQIHFCHAFPTTGGKPRPRALPLSTVKAGEILYDIAREREPVLLTNHQGNIVAPEFPIDWKKHDDALGALDWAWPARELRVRTAIDSQRRKGDDGKLFAWEMVHPFLDDEARTPVVWRSRIDLSGVDADKHAAVASTLAKVLARLSFVSKTKARCHVEVEPVEKLPEAPELKTGGTLALVLQTPALLADPRFQEVNGVPKSGAISDADMLALYRATFDELSDGSLALSHHFAQQHLEGGSYLGIRFQKKHRRPYNPWLLTDDGSVFVFSVQDAETAKEKLAAWLDTGLPVPAWAEEAFGKSWCENPYRPENGFGEVAVHQPKFATPQCEAIPLADPILPPFEKATATA